MDTTSEPKLGYFDIQQFALRFVGVSLRETETLYYQIYSILCIFLVVTFTIQETYGAFSFTDDIDRLSNVISIATSHILGVVKIFVISKNKAGFMKILNTLENGLFAPNFERGDGLEEELMSKCISQTFRQTVVYWMFVVGVIFFGMLASLLTRLTNADYKKWEMPLTPFALFEIRTTTYFLLIYIYQSISIIFFATIISSIDLLIVGVMAHIKTQFKFLKNIIKNVKYDISSANELSSNEYNKPAYQKHNLQEKFKYIVTYHQSILDLAEQFEKYFNFLILTVFLANTIVLCFTMYHASLYPMSNAKALGDFCYVTVICIQLLLFCYWGNEVALESQSLAFSCYEVNFVDMPKHFQKHLIFMMQRCQRPVILTAGKFINLSLSAYVSLLRASYSYYMVLRRNGDSE